MRLDVPEFKKCCCCVPLRYGLLTWGYLKLLVGVSLLILVLVASFTMEYTTPGMVVFWAVIICVCLADLSLNIVFIVGAHMKNYKLLRIFYYATMVGVVAYFLFCMAFFVLQLVTIHQMELSVTSDLVWRMVKEFAEVAVNIALDVYLLLLTRSEILKLQRNCRIQFTNNAADAECRFNLRGETPGLSVHGIVHDTIVTKNVEII